MKFLPKLVKRVLRGTYERVRLGSIGISRILFEYPRKNIETKKLVILNIQYIHTFSDMEFLCGIALKKSGFKVSAIICPGLDYCEREDFRTKRPTCFECRAETKRFCSAYGIEILREENSNGKIDSAKRIGNHNLSTSKVEYTYRNYLHYMKSFTVLDYGTWKRIEFSIEQFISFLENLNLGQYKIEKIITANGRFFQTGLAVDIIKTNTGFVTTEYFNDYRTVFGNNEYSTNNELEITKEALFKIEYDPLKADQFVSKKGKTEKIEGVKLILDNQLENVDEIKKKLDFHKYKDVLTFFPNVMWDSAWFGLGYFCHSPAAFIMQLNKIASNFPEILFVVRAHPGEKNAPAHMRPSGSIFSDISLKNVQLMKNLVFIDADSLISSYALGELSKYIVVWNGTLGLEFAARGRRIISIANSFYDKFDITEQIKSINQLENILKARKNAKLGKKEVEIAKRLIYTTRYLKRTTSPIHKGNICTKFFWQPFIKNESVFVERFPKYFNGDLNIYELNKLMNRT